MLPGDAKKDQTSHPSNPGVPRRASSQARPQREETEVRTALRVAVHP